MYNAKAKEASSGNARYTKEFPMDRTSQDFACQMEKRLDFCLHSYPRACMLWVWHNLLDRTDALDINFILDIFVSLCILT